jgi:hypothetical protein
MVIFESLLTSFETSLIFWGSWGGGENLLEPKFNHHQHIKLAQIRKTHCSALLIARQHTSLLREIHHYSRVAKKGLSRPGLPIDSYQISSHLACALRWLPVARAATVATAPAAVVAEIRIILFLGHK